MPIRFKNKLVLLKKEAVYGTDAAPEATDVIRASDVNLTPLEADEVSRDNATPYLGASDVFLAGKRVKIDFAVELAGAGTAGAAPAYAAALLGCGLSETLTAGEDTLDDSPVASGNPTGGFTFVKGDAFAGSVDRTVTLTCTTGGASGVAAFTVNAPAVGDEAEYDQAGVVMTDGAAFALPNGATITPTIGTDFAVDDVFTIALYRPCAEYKPVSESFDSLSLYFQQDKVMHKLTGVRGNVRISMDAKNLPKLQFSMIGIYSPPEASVLLAVNFDSFRDPIVHNSANTKLSLHGYSAIANSAEVDLGQGVVWRQRLNDEGVEITDRSASGTLVIEEPEIDVKDFYVAATGHVKDALSIIHGSTVGDVVEISAPKAQIGKPSLSESEGLRMMSLPMTFFAKDGNDELTLTIR